MILNNQKGIALVTALILSLLALAFMAVLLNSTISSTRISGIEARYNTALQVARGVSDYIANQISYDNLQCSNGTAVFDQLSCRTNYAVQLGSYSSLGNYSLNATMLSDPVEITSGNSTYELYAVRVASQAQNNPSEQAIIDFVYRLEY